MKPGNRLTEATSQTKPMLNWLVELWPWLLGAADLAAAIMVTVHAVLWKRDSRAVIAWVGLVWLAPLLGVFAYFCFGVNRIQRKAASLKVQQAWVQRGPPQLTSDDVHRRNEAAGLYPNLLRLAQLGYHLTGNPLPPGNHVEPLINGDQSYPAMLKAINEAQRSISLLTYIFDSDRAGDEFGDALAEANQRGVEVRILIDHVGASYSRANMVRRLRKAGLRTATFLPTVVPRLFKYANLRNHRKLLVVDGRIGFTGGTNIREGHWLSLQPTSPVQCLHFRLTGPVVAQLQDTFAVDWAFASGESLSGDLWFPSLERTGNVWARGIPDGPDEDFEKTWYAISGALAAAQERVLVVTPYFLPQAPLIHALNVTALRGVEVQIVLPAQCNIPVVQWAATAQHWQVLEKGCRIYLTPPPFDHTKLMVVDGVWSLIGSSNWDPRSLRLNFEYNVECYDDHFAQQLERLVESKIASAHELTLDEVNRRNFPVRLRDGLARLLTPYL
jgi:cardiolipin synthase